MSHQDDADEFGKRRRLEKSVESISDEGEPLSPLESKVLRLPRQRAALIAFADCLRVLAEVDAGDQEAVLESLRIFLFE